jgi:hypothetical protein
VGALPPASVVMPVSSLSLYSSPSPR